MGIMGIKSRGEATLCVLLKVRLEVSRVSKYPIAILCDNNKRRYLAKKKNNLSNYPISSCR